MVFSSLVFLFAYLPITLIIYYVVPRQGRNIFLFLINLVFYGWGEPKLVFLMLFNILFNFAGGYLVDKYRHDQKKKKLFLILTCILDIGILAVFKYTGMVADYAEYASVLKHSRFGNKFADRHQLLYIPDYELCY